MVSDDGLHCGGGIGFIGVVCKGICSSKRRRHDGRRKERKMGRKHELNRGEMSQS